MISDCRCKQYERMDLSPLVPTEHNLNPSAYHAGLDTFK